MRRLYWLLLWLISGGAAAQWDGWDYTFDREIKPWKELESQIPSYPADGQLLEFYVSPTTSHKFYVDAKSVSVGTDGIVRYTLVIRTVGGARNVSFEGIKCESREQKYYAIGQSDKSWTRARNPQWRSILFWDSNSQHAALFTDYFCDGKTTAGTAKQITDALRSGKPLVERGYGRSGGADA